jgi:alpha-tubulin suppressor-like RCC1 family protein
VYAWGLNNFGQLGIGKHPNTFKAIEVTALRDRNVKAIVGGEFHTLFLMDDGAVMGCGRNDSFQLGPLNKEDFDAKHQNLDFEESEKLRENPESVYFPTKLDFEVGLKQVMANSHYSYGVQTDNKVRTWGDGTSYVLGNGKEDEIQTPHTINPKLLKREVGQFCLGYNFIMFSGGEQDFEVPEMQDGVIVPIPKKRGRKRTRSGKTSVRAMVVEGEKKKGSLKDMDDEPLDLKRSAEDRDEGEMSKPLKKTLASN